VENKIVLLDTSILIDYFRKQDKSKTLFVSLSDTYSSFCISSITEFEIYSGSTIQQLPYWESLLQKMVILPFDSEAARVAANLQQLLKVNRITIDKADLFIASISVVSKAPLATLNKKHFQNIPGVQLVA
jgi:tRNA(fMet)-specific endonuclease VapC